MPETDLDCPECGGQLYTDELDDGYCWRCDHEFALEFFLEDEVSKGYWSIPMLREYDDDITTSNIEEANQRLEEFFNELAEAIREGDSIGHGKVRDAKDLLEEELEQTNG